MQKGFISLPIAIIIALTVTVLGGGGYAVYKVNEIQEESNTAVTQLEEKIEQMVATTTVEVPAEFEQATISESVATSSSEIIIETEPVAVKVQSESVVPAYIAPEAPVVEAYIPPEPFDMCKNINGLQTQVPDGYKVTGTTCIKVEDKCPTLNGIQEEIPDGMLLTREYGCISERDLDKIEERERELKQAERDAEVLADECSELKKAVYEMDQEMLRIQSAYQEKIANAYANGGGTMEGLNAQASNYKTEMSNKLYPIEFERNTVANEYNFKCAR